MTKPRELIFPEIKGKQSAGIQIEYIKRRDTLNISGFYDSFICITGTDISFKDFCNRLGIDLSKVR